MHPALPTALVLSAVLLAGCGALSGGQPTDSASALTPAPEPVDSGATATLDPGELPPGVDASGTVNATRLRDAHRAVLAGRSFTLVRASTATTDSETDPALTDRVAVDGDRLYRYERVPPSLVVETYFEGAAYHSRFRNTTSGETEYSSGRLEPSGPERSQIATATVDFVGASADEVTRDGFVQTVAVTYGPESAETTIRLTLQNVGNTTVDPPDWLENATVTPEDRTP